MSHANARGSNQARRRMHLFHAASVLLGGCLPSFEYYTDGPRASDVSLKAAFPSDAGATNSDLPDAASGSPDIPDARADSDLDARGVDADGMDSAALNRYAAAVLQDSPTAYFRFEDAKGTLVPKNEISGSLISAQLGGNVSFEGQGIGANSRALHFGDANPNLSLFGPIIGGGVQAFALEAWLQFDIQPNRIFTNVDAQRTRTNMFVFTGDIFRTETWVDDTHLAYANSPIRAATKTWFHLVFQYDPDSNSEVLYINGAAPVDAQRLNPSTSRLASQAPLRWLFEGAIDELAVYSAALPPARVTAHYLAR
jgi:Concanavalin A-like lectin/glucanases superfamily